MKKQKKTKVESAAIIEDRAMEILLRPAQLAARWSWHPESVRRALRQRRLDSIVIGRARLIPLGSVLKLEAEGRVMATA